MGTHKTAKAGLDDAVERFGLCGALEMLSAHAGERARVGRDRAAWERVRSVLDEASRRVHDAGPGVFAPRPDASAPRLAAPFSRRLKRFLRRAEVFGLLPDGSWTQGGCWILGEGLARWIGPDARLYMTTCDRHDGGDHVVCEVDGLFVDGDGVQSEAALLRKLVRYEWCVRPRVVDFDAEAMRRGGAFEPADVSPKLADALASEFGHFAEHRWSRATSAVGASAR